MQARDEFDYLCGEWWYVKERFKFPCAHDVPPEPMICAEENVWGCIRSFQSLVLRIWWGWVRQSYSSWVLRARATCRCRLVYETKLDAVHMFKCSVLKVRHFDHCVCSWLLVRPWELRERENRLMYEKTAHELARVKADRESALRTVDELRRHSKTQADSYDVLVRLTFEQWCYQVV